MLFFYRWGMFGVKGIQAFYPGETGCNTLPIEVSIYLGNLIKPANLEEGHFTKKIQSSKEDEIFIHTKFTNIIHNNN